jgi:chromosome segregation ATPase
MEAAVQEQSIDSLASLEEHITRAVQVITNLRNENSQLQQRLKGALDELKSESAARGEIEARSGQINKEKDELVQQVKRLSEELNELRGERKQVRSRIEKLLSQLDLLSAS